MIRKRAIFVLVVMVLMLVGCDSGSSKLIGKWEGYVGDEAIEFKDLDSMIWGENTYDIEVSDGKILIDFMLFKSEMAYTIENNKLVMTEQDGTIWTYVKEGSIQSDEEDMKQLAGEWGHDLPLYTFTESGELTIKSLPETELPSKGKFIAGDGVIRYESESDQERPIFLEYSFDEEKLSLMYSGGEAVELVRVDTVEMREKAAAAYANRFDTGTLEQEEIAALAEDERKQYISDKVIRYLFLKMDGPSTESGKRGALDFDVDIRNMSSRTIKYISFQVFVRNAVGDLVECKIGQTKQDKSVTLSITGPIAPEEAGGVGGYWPSAVFNSLVTSWEIADVDIEYMDGERLIINGGDILPEEAVKPTEVAKAVTPVEVSFNGIELLFTKTYGELQTTFADVCEIEKTSENLFMNMSHHVTDFSLVFSDANPDESDKPVAIIASPSDETTTYNGIISGMMLDEIVQVLGEPLSIDYDGEKWYRLQYEYDKFDANISCHEEYGFLTFLLSNKNI